VTQSHGTRILAARVSHYYRPNPQILSGGKTTSSKSIHPADTTRKFFLLKQYGMLLKTLLT
jgi:hypothetical protein